MEAVATAAQHMKALVFGESAGGAGRSIAITSIPGRVVGCAGICGGGEARSIIRWSGGGGSGREPFCCGGQKHGRGGEGGRSAVGKRNVVPVPVEVAHIWC